jgi:hypothetical protein
MLGATAGHWQGRTVARYTRDQAPIPARPTMTLWLAVISATMRSTSRPSARYGATVA